MGYRDPACPSQDELAEELAAELDGSQIDACLALTPNERLERLRALLAFVETANDRGDRSRPAH